MRIATWNVERLKHKSALNQILLTCEQVQADILVLTETDTRLQPTYRYCLQTPPLTKIQSGYYQATENRVSIFTNYQCVRQHPTYDPYTALCVELETEYGDLLVYGTIIGIYGNRHSSFQKDLLKQTADFRRLSAGQYHLCVCGDFNCSFSDNYYFTQSGRLAMLQSFSENRLRLLTAKQAECIDHIAVSERFVGEAEVQIAEWNQDKILSDHKGIVVSLS